MPFDAGPPTSYPDLPPSRSTQLPISLAVTQPETQAAHPYTSKLKCHDLGNHLFLKQSHFQGYAWEGVQFIDSL